MARRSATAALFFFLLAASCHDRGGAPPASSAAPSPLPSAAASARRPTRRYFLGRTQNRCEVFSVDHDEVSTPEPTPCPADLLVGERIRLAGKTCMREGADPERREPVVCPDPLTNREKRDLAAQKAVEPP